MELAASVINPKNNNCIHQRRVKLSIVGGRKLVNKKCDKHSFLCIKSLVSMGSEQRILPNGQQLHGSVVLCLTYLHCDF